MDIAIDANILIADPWLRSQNIRMLVDFARKTNSWILLSEVVEAEAKAHFHRQCVDAIQRVEGALRNLARLGIDENLGFQGDESILAAVASWENNFQHVFDTNIAVRLPLNDSVLAEVVKRSIARVPPCSESGDGLRDAVIWLNLLEFCESKRKDREIAFISANTRDFADADKSSLRKELKEDTERFGVRLSFYPSLELFLEKRAQPIAHITSDWVRSRLSMRAVESAITCHIDTWGLNGKFRVSDRSLRDAYVPAGEPSITSVSMEVDNVFVWKFGDEHTEIGLKLDVYVEARMECNRISIPRGYSASTSAIWHYDSYDDEDEYPLRRALDCFAELGLNVSAEVVGDDITILDIEDVYGL